MKKTIIILTILAGIFSVSAQQNEVKYQGKTLKIIPKDKDELKNTALIYKYHIDSLSIYARRFFSGEIFVRNKAQTFLDAIVNPVPDFNSIYNLRNSLESQKLFNNKMLNILFADEVATYFNGGSDLSLEKYYTTLDADDSSLSFGVNFDIRGESKLNRMKWLFSVGFKAKAGDKFATVVKNGKLDNTDLGITGKVTLIGKGIINFSDKLNCEKKVSVNRKEIIKKYRKNLLEEYDTKIKKYVSNDIDDELKKIKTIYDAPNNNEGKLKEKQEEFIKEKYHSYYEEIANAEIKFVKENKLYKYLWDHWGNIDFFAPIGQKKYTISPSENTTTKPRSTEFYPLKITGTYTNLVKWSAGQSLYLTAQLSAFNNNNILVDETETMPFQTITQQSISGTGTPTDPYIINQAVTESTDVYVLPNGFDRFITGVARFETVFFARPWIGISPAIEKNFGQYYSKTNWKLGIPFSLKDKDGKSSINFEVQWKEVNDNHLVGISASFLFGKFLK
ncbi:hypothetical protein [Flavobacterium sp.]|uniref:hypothetical protein n=1 Tax=Flavobacterium sp. TaxID=239 RepID=UPI002620A1AE|nr:hypothetical protein [Flavobacterium sp.]